MKKQPQSLPVSYTLKPVSAKDGRPDDLPSFSGLSPISKESHATMEYRREYRPLPGSTPTKRSSTAEKRLTHPLQVEISVNDAGGSTDKNFSTPLKN